MILEAAITFFGSTLGTFAFALLLHAPGKSWLISSFLGGIGYTVYWVAAKLGVPDSAAMFIGALLASSLAQIAARKKRMIATIFVTLSIIPCVPGYGLFRSMSLMAQGTTDEGMIVFIRAMEEIMMIALALGVSSFFAHRQKHPEVK